MSAKVPPSSSSSTSLSLLSETSSTSLKTSSPSKKINFEKLSVTSLSDYPESSDSDSDTPIGFLPKTYSYVTAPLIWLYNFSENFNYLFTGSSNHWQADKTRTILSQMTAYLEEIYLVKCTLTSRTARLMQLQKVLVEQIKASPKDFQKILLECIKLLTSPSRYSDPEARRRALFESLEKAQQSKHYNKRLNKMKLLDKEKQIARYPDIYFLHKIYEALILQVNLLDYGTTVVFDMFEMGRERAIDYVEEESSVTLLKTDDLASKIDKITTALDYVSPEYCASRVGIVWGKLEGWLNWNFCPQRGNNFFSSLFKETYTNVKGDKQEVQLLRFGSPTKEYSTWLIGALVRNILTGPYAEIISEFKCFLDFLKKEGKSYAIFNHQNIIATRVGNEAHRTSAMKRLAEEYPETFFLVNFPMHGEFFEQTGTLDFPESCQKSSNFLSMLNMRVLYSFNFPMDTLIAKGQTKTEVRKDITDILSAIYDIFFQKKKTITVIERMSFQLITYVYLRKYLCVRLGLTAYSSNCKDSIDRTAILNALDTYLYYFSRGSEKSPKSEKTILGILFFGAWLVKEQPVLKSRSNLLKNALACIDSIPSRHRKRLQEIYDIIGVTHEINIEMPTQDELLASIHSDRELKIKASSKTKVEKIKKEAELTKHKIFKFEGESGSEEEEEEEEEHE